MLAASCKSACIDFSFENKKETLRFVQLVKVSYIIRFTCSLFQSIFKGVGEAQVRTYSSKRGMANNKFKN